MPTNTPTNSPTTTATDTPTLVPTETAATGSAAVTLTTSDGGQVPEGALVCAGEACQTVGAGVRSTAISLTTLTFADVAAGSYDMAVTDTAPYPHVTASVTVVAGETASNAIMLQLATVTIVPTGPETRRPSRR